MSDKKDLPRRWSNIKKVLERGGPFCHPEFEPSSQLMDQIFNQCRILIIGAGGLGCELLKDLALMGFKKLDVVDMDTIELSNLNRQFLFRQKDIGRSKAECAAEFINKRIRGCQVTPHCCKLQSLDEDFFTNFNIIISGLDNIVTRRWINGLLISTLQYSDDGEVDQSSIIPLIDGGTEGFKGNARVIIPGLTACIECTLDLYPPQVNYPLCTIANTPRLPEHCIEYVKLIQWGKEDPFNGAVIDGDDPQHINWIYEKSVERANQFNISGLTYRLVQGVVKNIIPAVASTNAAIAAACATEAFKLATSCCAPFSNYMVFNNVDGIYTYTYEAEKKDDCIGCSQKSQPLEINDLEKTKLEDIIQLLKENAAYQMKSPGLTTTDSNGKNKTLYMENIPSIEEATRKNLKKTLNELGLVDGSELVVNDITSPNAIIFKIRSRTMDVN